MTYIVDVKRTRTVRSTDHVPRASRMGLSSGMQKGCGEQRHFASVMALPTDGAGCLEHTLEDFKGRVSECAQTRVRSEAQVRCRRGLLLAVCHRSLLASLHNPSQELLTRMQAISNDIQRMNGVWNKSSGFRAWNQCSTTAQDPRPWSVESFR